MSAGCILYVIHDASNFVPEMLAQAQREATRHAVPLAAIYLMEQWDEAVLNALLSAEANLASLGIPLMILIGHPQKTLAGLVHHTQPLRIFKDSTPPKGTRTPLRNHVHPWPGRVITITELINLYDAGQLTC